MGVAVGIAHRDFEFAATLWADFLNAILGRAELGSQVRIGELALAAAVDGPGSGPALDGLATRLARAGRRATSEAPASI